MRTTATSEDQDSFDSSSIPHHPSPMSFNNQSAEPIEVLIKEARRRQRRRRALIGIPAVLALGIIAGLVAAQGSLPPPTSSSHERAAHTPSSPSVHPTVTVSASGLVNWGRMRAPRVFTTPAGLFIAWFTSPYKDPTPRGELARVDPRTGKVESERALDAASFPLDVLGVDGSLFVVERSSTTTGRLVRYDRRTLRVTGSWTFAEPIGSAVYAGGAIWFSVGDRQLDRMTASTGQVERSVLLPTGAKTMLGVSLATNARGSVLVVSATAHGTTLNYGQSFIERRNPVSGALEVTKSGPGSVGGIAGSYVWLSYGPGMMGGVHAVRLTHLSTLGPCHTGMTTRTCVFGTNGIGVQTKDGLVWVTQSDGGRAENFCAKPDGQVLASLPVPIHDEVLAIGGDVFFVDTFARDPYDATVVREVRLPASCRPMDSPVRLTGFDIRQG